MFAVARSEFVAKLRALQQAAPPGARLADIVAADRAAGRAATKGSATRCLHRLLAAISFVKILLARLVAAPGAPLRDAASEAYEAALAPLHTMLIRSCVRAGMLTLPARGAFLAALGETEESARPRCERLVAASGAVVVAVSRLLDGIDFPASDGAQRKRGKGGPSIGRRAAAGGRAAAAGDGRALFALRVLQSLSPLTILHTLSYHHNTNCAVWFWPSS